MDSTLIVRDVQRLIHIALHEDIGEGDITGEATLPLELSAAAELTVKGEGGIICGLDVGGMVASTVDPALAWTPLVAEGASCSPGTVVARLEGPARSLLTAERTILNFMQRMSGVATATARYVRAVEGTGCRILDTRKTIPGWRILDKYAVRVGGGTNHRLGLWDMVMIKDNHIEAAGGITAAVEACMRYLDGRRVGIEVETETLEQVEEALRCEGVTRIMFDNFSPQDMRRAVALVGGRLETEASGGITLETIRSYAETGVNFISVGALTHSVRAMDISLNIVEGPGA